MNGLMGLKLLEQIEERKPGQATKIVDVTKGVDGQPAKKD